MILTCIFQYTTTCRFHYTTTHSLLKNDPLNRMQIYLIPPLFPPPFYTVSTTQRTTRRPILLISREIPPITLSIVSKGNRFIYTTNGKVLLRGTPLRNILLDFVDGPQMGNTKFTLSTLQFLPPPCRVISSVVEPFS